jgi:hypothetical protein
MTDTNLPLNTQFDANTPNNSVEDQKTVAEKKAKKSKDGESTLKVVDNPVRHLPAIINELLEKNFSIILSKNGYYVEGFYGLNPDGKTGYAFAQETTEANTLVFFDAKGHKHLVKSFEDLVKFNSHVWGIFYKQSEDYKKPNSKWFGYMLELGALNITPGR